MSSAVRERQAVRREQQERPRQRRRRVRDVTAEQRATEYARCTAALRERQDDSGAEGRFDQTLTNALAAIVAARWPAELHNPDGRVKYASQLLTVIEQQTGRSGRISLEDLEPRLESAFGEPIGATPTVVDIPTLRDGLAATQPARHARGAGRSSDDHMKALVALNDDADRLDALAREACLRRSRPAWGIARQPETAALDLAATRPLDI